MLSPEFPGSLRTPLLPWFIRHDVTLNAPGLGSVYSVRQAGEIAIGKAVKFVLMVFERKF
jgi:hypothetical protein